MLNWERDNWEEDAMSAFVEFKNVGKTYHMCEADIEALKDVNFTIEKGEFCVVVGASLWSDRKL